MRPKSATLCPSTDCGRLVDRTQTLFTSVPSTRIPEGVTIGKRSSASVISAVRIMRTRPLGRITSVLGSGVAGKITRVASLYTSIRRVGCGTTATTFSPVSFTAKEGYCNGTCITLVLSVVRNDNESPTYLHRRHARDCTHRPTYRFRGPVPWNTTSGNVLARPAKIVIDICPRRKAWESRHTEDTE